ncbi:MAG: PD40 domain-containing protein [Ignavibacteriae bacterium]|nr:PD40 domain-containing protein [Ignavibacteriota bacterium]
MQRNVFIACIGLAFIAVVLTGCSSSKPADIARVTGGVVENLGEKVNSPWNDYAPAVSANGTLFFTSRRPNPKRVDYGDDVYRTNNIKGEWEKPTYLSEMINTPESQGAISVSGDGKTLYVALCEQPDGYGRCDIYFAEWNERGTEWSRVRNLNNLEGKDLRMEKRADNFEYINTTYWETQPSIAQDGRTLYFCSDRPGGYGGTDIWMSQKDESGKWGRPVNLGPDINTKGDERTPAISFDNKTLYYTSDGYPDGEPAKAAGGFDIYVTRFQGSRWSRPMNLGYPVNSSDNEAFIAMTLGGDTLYYASDREGGYGGFDIYMLLDPPYPPDAMIKIDGVVTDAETNQPLSSTPVTIEDVGTGEIIFKAQSLESGQYTFIIPAGKEYRISSEQKGYLFKSEVFEVPELTLNRRWVKNIALIPIPPVVTVPVKTNLTVLFDFDQATLRPESKPELDRAMRFILQNPGRKFEISAHTDALGTEEYNLDLSERRAQAVRRYLVDHGVPTDIIFAKGYGESQPIDDNETPQGRQRNRRVELTVIE